MVYFRAHSTTNQSTIYSDIFSLNIRGITLEGVAVYRKETRPIYQMKLPI